MFIWIAVIIGTVFLDMLTKHLTMIYMTYDYAREAGQSIPIIENVLHLTRVHNTGMAFGMMSEKDERWVFMVISTVAILGILGYMVYRIYIKKNPLHWVAALSLTLIVGGGIGNMIDRSILGYVVDMIDFRLINFAVFNVADSFVCIGAGLLMLYMILDMIREEKAERAAKRAAARIDREVAEPASDPLTEQPAEAISEEVETVSEPSEENVNEETSEDETL